MNALKKRLLEFSSAAEWVKREGERVDDMWEDLDIRQQLFWSVTGVIVYLAPAIMPKTNVKR
mgnify:CR=1 FL=1